MLILGFLRSCAPFLAAGPIPPFTHTRRRQQIPEGYDEVMEDDADIEDSDGGLVQLENASTGERGTVLVTLRNVAPYTQW
jgi:25S rRNA (uracil2634-N3)-methyltransferase